MTRPKVFLDLDRTLLDSTQANAAIWPELAKHYPFLHPDVCVAEESNFYVHPTPDTYAYDIEAHIRSYAIDATKAFELLAGSELSDGRFELPYAEQLVDYLKAVADVAVLTFGIESTQRYKARLCPSLRDVQIITTLGRKREFLEKQGECWLVDDKDLGPELPDKVHLVQVMPPGTTVRDDKPWPVFSNLKEVKEYMYDQMH